MAALIDAGVQFITAVGSTLTTLGIGYVATVARDIRDTTNANERRSKLNARILHNEGKRPPPSDDGVSYRGYDSARSGSKTDD